MTKEKKDKFTNLIIGTVCFVLIIQFINFFLPFQFQSTISNIKQAGINLASIIISHDFKTVAEIKSNYKNPRSDLRILIVPGHEPNYGGAEYSNLKERDINVELGQYLKGFLEENNNYKVFITRDQHGWNNTFSDYFVDNKEDILEWINLSKKDHSENLSIDKSNNFTSKVKHNYAAPEIATRLYAITKWSNENDIDVVIHVHINDNVGHGMHTPGKYSGFSIYVPDEQYGNSKTTKVLAKSIFERLRKYNPVSNLPVESEGIIDDPELIAIGSNNTSDAASLLIEYGYIYESQFSNPEVRRVATKDFAYQTYLGLQDFFDSQKSLNLSRVYDSSVIPYYWNDTFNSNSLKASPDVFALQTVLMSEGLYPPKGKNKNDCPRTGKIGPCTKDSIKLFKERYGIVEDGVLIGPKMLEILNQI